MIVSKAKAKSLSHVRLFATAMDCSPAGSSVHGIFQARVLEWIAIPFSRGAPDPGLKPASLTPPALVDGIFTTSATWEVAQCKQTLLQLKQITNKDLLYSSGNSAQYSIIT